MTMRRGAKIFHCTIVLTLFLLAAIAHAGADDHALLDESKACLECHGRQGITVTFQNKEKIEALVDAEKFKMSVHTSLGCAGCHTDFSAANHPERSFRSKEQYQAKAALVCRQCHTDEQIRAKPVHAALLSKGGASAVCTNCHSAHAVTAVSGGKSFTSEKQYCLGCHKHAMGMTLRNGETITLTANTSALDASVHAKLSCFDCHFGFSTTQHPKRNFRTGRDFSIAHSESCRRCHFDKYTKTLESIHYAMLSKGNLNAPVCTDCHGSHSVTQARADRMKSAQRCGKCHKDIYTTYASSVHGNALVNEQNKDVPVCADCHTAHTIEDARTLDYREKVPDICGRCHANDELMRKYGLYPGVVQSYLQDFHGVTLTLYRQQKDSSPAASRKSIAMCVDCHGVHDIAKIAGSPAHVVKARLVKRCQKCHPGATEDFPDAWLSHYQPSLTNAPLVFAINLGYKIFIPFMLIGLILQILLHIWRFAVNR